jgi:hypothetical protein
LSRRALGGSTFSSAMLSGLTSILVFIIAVIGVLRAYLALHGS